MAGSNRLLWRNGVWHYRRRVPLHLVQEVGKCVIKFSLKTSNLKEAKRRREVADIEWSARFAAAQNGKPEISKAETGVAAPPKRSSDLAHLVVDYVMRMDARIQQRLAEDPPESEAQRAELFQDTEVELQILGNRDDPRSFEYADGTIRRILGEADIVLDEVRGSSFAELVRRALMELGRRKLAYLTDNCSRTWTQLGLAG